MDNQSIEERVEYLEGRHLVTIGSFFAFQKEVDSILARLYNLECAGKPKSFIYTWFPLFISIIALIVAMWR
ncbi:MAG: hypothetical protein H6Q71_2247 [Firmicutes bacterium]|nr:hypothetical protein [Bacillota bacterium]